MLIEACMAKIHRATVTEADLDYVGSITIDQNLLDASGMKPFQYVFITNRSDGTLWRTYIMPGERGKGDICLNGPPARHFHRGDIVIILAKVLVTPEELDDLETTVVFVTKKNKVKKIVRHGTIKPKTKG